MTQNSGSGGSGSTDGKVTDPVCGMRIDPASAAGSAQYEGQRYYFCSASCKSKFDGDPARYAAAAQHGGEFRG